LPVLYLIEQGSTLRKDGDVFVVSKDDVVLKEIHAIEVEQIIIFGRITLTTPVIDYILQKGIDCVFCNSYGKFHGRLISNESAHGNLRLKQAEIILNVDRKLDCARAIIQGKVHNQRTIMLRYRRENNLTQLEQTIEMLENTLRKITECWEIASLQGLEGSSSASYYQSFKAILKNDMGFSARVRRPPTDPVNSLLSFGYTLLAYNIQSAVGIVGLDPFLSFVHSIEQSRPGLALDLMEEFRPIIVDSMVLWLVNTGVMTELDFERPEQSGEMVAIKPESIKKLIHYYELKVQSKIYHPAAGGQTSYRHCFELQARELAKVILGQKSDYSPFQVR